MRFPHFGLLVVAALFVASHLAAGEVKLIEELDRPPGIEKYDPQYDAYLAKKKAIREERAKIEADELQKNAEKIKALQDEDAKLAVPATDNVTVDGETIQVKQPEKVEEVIGKKTVRDIYEISTEDFDIEVHDRWSLNKNDFLMDDPQYIVVDGKAGDPVKYWGFTFSIKNTTTKSRRIMPVFAAVTNKGVFSYQTGGFLPQRMAADSMYRPLTESADARDKKLLSENVAPLESVGALATELLGEGGATKLAVPPEPVATFQPGQTRWGIALWRDFDDEFTELKILVHGLTNAHRYNEKLRRVLVLSFSRNDDEFDVERTQLVYLGKEWSYQWMWEQDTTVPVPEDPKAPQIMDKTLATPSGAQRPLWLCPFRVTNSTPEAQKLKIHAIRFCLPVSEQGKPVQGIEVDVGGQKAYVEVQIVDDGRSSIYKAQLLRELAKSDPAKEAQRFAAQPDKVIKDEGMTHTIEPGKALDLLGVFDPNDIDWASVREQVEAQLTLAMDKVAASDKNFKEVSAASPDLAKKGQIPLYNPSRDLTCDRVALKDGRAFTGMLGRNDDQVVILDTKDQGRLEFGRAEVEKVEKGEMSLVKEQVLAALPAALEAAKKKKQVVAVLDAESGLSTGQFRISRSYRQPGKIEESWLKAWEEAE
jgi:hypothetical protein